MKNGDCGEGLASCGITQNGLTRKVLVRMYIRGSIGLRGTVMKRLVIWMMAWAICLGVGPITEAQQSSGAEKASARALPAQECKAIEQYIAKIDAARSIREKAKREEKYEEAQAELKAALKGRDDATLLDQASEYAKSTELVASTDPTDSKLSEILDRRLKLRSGLLERCQDYTATR